MLKGNQDFVNCNYIIYSKIFALDYRQIFIEPYKLIIWELLFLKTFTQNCKKTNLFSIFKHFWLQFFLFILSIRGKRKKESLLFSSFFVWWPYWVQVDTHFYIYFNFFLIFKIENKITSLILITILDFIKKNLLFNYQINNKCKFEIYITKYTNQ